jgi:23S rRNA pseudouridine2605 synthase
MLKQGVQLMSRKRVPKDVGLPGSDLSGPQRLQRLLAACGVGSRRDCERLIIEGRVEVDGNVVRELGTRADLDKQTITVDGERVRLPKLQYYVLNKPAGVISTSRDPSGRVRVIDLISTDQRVYNVGRLDKSSEGLILVTNDGDLANRLTHPKYGVEKKYHVYVAGRPDWEDLNRLRRGIFLEDAKVRVSHVKIRKNLRDGTWLEITLDEGRNREIRRMLARLGHKVLRLRRVAIGPLTMGELPVGSHRTLLPDEVQRLKHAAQRSHKTEISKPKSSDLDNRFDRPRSKRFDEFHSASRRKSKRSVPPKQSGNRKHRPIARRAENGFDQQMDKEGQRKRRRFKKSLPSTQQKSGATRNRGRGFRLERSFETDLAGNSPRQSNVSRKKHSRRSHRNSPNRVGQPLDSKTVSRSGKRTRYRRINRSGR